jgi:uncharacterized membrane protein
MKMTLVQEFVAAAPFVAALGCGLMAGVFFTFSTFVMKALARLPAETGIAAMQSINIMAVRSWFLVAFLGTAAMCGLAAFSTLGRWNETSAVVLFTGCGVFLSGTFLVTLFFNVPMNNALAAMPASDPDRAARWTRYVATWTAWNHVRTFTSLAAAALLFIGWAGGRTRPHRPTAIGKQTIEREPVLNLLAQPAGPEIGVPRGKITGQNIF